MSCEMRNLSSTSGKVESSAGESKNKRKTWKQCGNSCKERLKAAAPSCSYSVPRIAMTHTIALRPIGLVRAGRSEAIDDRWDSVGSRIELDPAIFGPDATLGLDAFSHVEIV